MRKFLFLIALFPALVGAQPYVVADVVAGVSQCGIYLDAAAKVTIPASALKCTYDVSTVSTGSHTIKMTAITVADPVWGTQESAQSAPLAFSRPAAPSVPSGLRLTP